MRNAFGSIAMVGGLIFSSIVSAQEPDNPPSIRIKLKHPDRQLEEILKLFKRSKAGSPAAALAAWKRASKNPNQLGKPLEALIASFNPRMVGELKTLDQAEVSIQFDQETGQPVWSAILPKDDGTFAALGSALVLSGGAAELPLGEVAVDRLAGPGSALLAKVEAGTILAGDRPRLKLAKTRIEVAPESEILLKNQGGLRLKVEPGSLKGSNSLLVRRFEEFTRPSDLHGKEIRKASGSVEIDLDFQNRSFIASLAHFDWRSYPKVTLNPSWYDWTPNDHVILTFAAATDPAARSWADIFALADRVEKVDPSRAEVASLQVRLELLARIAGLRLETDLLRHLVGISGWVGSSDSKQINNALLVFHLDDVTVAERIVVNLKPLPGAGPLPGGEPDRPRWLGKIEGQSLRVSRSDRDLVFAWGDGVYESSLKARNEPDHSAGPILREMMVKDQQPLFGGFAWPERIPVLRLPKVVREKNEPARPSILWQVYPENDFAIGLGIGWSEIDELVHRWMDRLPLDPPPDH